MEEQTRMDLTAFSEKIQQLREQIRRVIIGQHQAVDLILTAVLANGHVLIEGVPGVAKTLTARLVARLVNAGFSRIQFTPDLMPSDVLGTTVFNRGDGGKAGEHRRHHIQDGRPLHHYRYAEPCGAGRNI